MLSDKPFQVPPYLLERAASMPRVRMVIAGADHPVVLKSVQQASDAGIIEPVLVGDTDTIQNITATIGWDMRGLQIVQASGEDKVANTAVRMCKTGDAAALMKGHVHTDCLMKAVIDRERGLRTSRRISHIFHMTVPDQERVLMITDGAINIAPDTATKIDIINNAVLLAHALGNKRPRVALLSGTEVATTSMPSSMDAAEIKRKAKAGAVPDADVDGPFAFDNAISPNAAKLKGIEGRVAGQADIVVVPNIETGNSLFKMMVYFMSGLAAGVVMGATVPIVLTSRADPPEARFAAAAIAAIVASSNQK